ncbi:MAG TPA: hypothetical protein VKA82_09210 [Rubrobacter sp.]|nr:hypothetical protein [Rubrobacter sp.]
MSTSGFRGGSGRVDPIQASDAHPTFLQSDVGEYRIPEDVPGAIELFRMSYERLKESGERRGTSL